MTAFLPIVVALLLLFSAMLAASETALFALLRMESTRQKLAAHVRNAVERMMARPLESLLVIIGLNEASNVFAECLATTFLLTWLGPIGAWISVPLMLGLVLIFADITPKTFALGFPAGVARFSAAPLAAFSSMLHPIVKWLTPAAGPPRPAPVSEEEFKALLRAGEVLGEVEPQERELIHKVFDFGNRRVVEIMTPREKIFWLDVNTHPNHLIDEVIGGHFSRVPIYRGHPDNILGILHVKDLVTRRLEPLPPRLERLIRPAYFVPPGKSLGALFDEMRRGRFQLAIVVDEYERVVGLLTLEDLLEELFGEISDEFDYEGPELMPVGPGEWLASGSISIERLSEAVGNGIAFPAERETLGSYVLSRLKRVPHRGERFRLGNLDASVERVRGASIELVRLKERTGAGRVA
ncbi:MAG TPA: hemolysin family protein [Candidatus Binataceae bacterium]|nr:hemolysin family protein [Candidatus Binataceae bacterium]